MNKSVHARLSLCTKQTHTHTQTKGRTLKQQIYRFARSINQSNINLFIALPNKIENMRLQSKCEVTIR